MKALLLFSFCACVLMAGCSKQVIENTDADERTEMDVANGAKRTRTVQENYYNEVYTIPCANFGEGEQVSIVGTAELITEITLIGAVKTTSLTFRIKNAKGKGSVTKANYTANGGFIARITSSSKDSRYSFSYDERITVRAPGRNNDYLYRLSASQINGPRGNVIKPYQVKEIVECN